MVERRVNVQQPPMPSALLVDCTLDWLGEYEGIGHYNPQELFFDFLRMSFDCDSLCDIFIGF